MNRHPGAEPEHTVPVTLVRQLVELLRRWQIPAEELFAGSALAEAPIDPFGRIPLGTMGALLERARIVTREPGLGYYLALQEKVSTYGYVGLAASSASTLRGALDLAIAYAPVFSSALSLTLRVEGDRAFLRVTENTDLGSVRDIIIINVMLGLETIAHAVTGRRVPGSADVAIPAPAYHSRFAHLVPGWRFDRPAHLLVMDAGALDWPILAADPLSLELMRALCERELTNLGFDEDLVEDVRRLIARDSGGFRSLSEVAQEMSISRRTLTRRLAARGASFSDMVESARRDQALALLRTRLPIDTIAGRLEYSSASTFVRAFRSWTGRTPAAYRREGRHGAGPLLRR